MMKTARALWALLGLALAAHGAEPGDAARTGAKQADPDSGARKAQQPQETVARAMQVDRLELEATVVTGDSELPKVLYIVPWKKADLGELPGQPFNTLLDEVLQPLDRDVFRREVKYYYAVTQGAQAHEAASAPPR